MPNPVSTDFRKHFNPYVPGKTVSISEQRRAIERIREDDLDVGLVDPILR